VVVGVAVGIIETVMVVVDYVIILDINFIAAGQVLTR
jgi:hypothetical protein